MKNTVTHFQVLVVSVDCCGNGKILFPTPQFGKVKKINDYFLPGQLEAGRSALTAMAETVGNFIGCQRADIKCEVYLGQKRYFAVVDSRILKTPKVIAELAASDLRKAAWGKKIEMLFQSIHSRYGPTQQKYAQAFLSSK